MPNLTLYISTTENALLAGQNVSSRIDPNSLPLYFGDTLTLNIWLLARQSNVNPVSYAIVPTNGLQLFVYIDDGKVGGTIYTSQIVWTSDPNNQFFFANLPLNTTNLQTLLGSSPTATAFLKIGYVVGGLQTTVLSQSVTIGVGLPSAAVGQPPAGQTALSVEIANNTYFPIKPVNGQALYLATPNGKIIAVIAVDNPDGTASLQGAPSN